MLCDWRGRTDPNPGSVREAVTHHSRIILGKTSSKGTAYLCLALYRISRAHFPFYSGAGIIG